jgi:hypothetical protein
MYELALLIIVVTVVVLAIRRGKPTVDAPVIIDQADFHATFSPQLKCVLSLVDAINSQFSGHPPQGDIATQYFEVQAPERAEQLYLLAVALRGGRWYFQTIEPSSSLGRGSHLQDIREFSEVVLQHHPLAEPSNEQVVSELLRVITVVTQEANIEVTLLQG